MNWNQLGSNTKKLITLGVALFAIAIISSRLYFRLDVTEDNAYTLSEGSLGIARKLDHPVDVKLYFSKSLKDMPPMIKQYGNRIKDVLREYVSASGGKISLDIIDPRPDTDDEEWALKYGIQGVPIGNESLYLGIVLISGEKEIAIPYLDPRKEEFLEYDLAEAFVKIKTATKPKLGLLSSLPLNGNERMEKWAIMQSLENSFDVVELKPENPSIDADIKVIFLVHPKNLEDKALYAIDQFVMAGGRLLVAVDPFSRVDAALSQQGGGGAMYMNNQQDSASDLKKLFDAWDIEFTRSQVVGDQARGTSINAGSGPITYPLFMTLMEDDINDKHKVTSQLRQVLYAEGGAFSLKNGSTNKFEALISTSDDSGETPAAMMKFQQPDDIASRFKGLGKKATLAAIVSGKFKSAFASGAPKDVTGTPLKETKEDAVVILVGDVDFMQDGNSVNKMRLGSQVLMTPRNDNLNFVLNAAEYLGGNQDLISIRTSGQISRPFTKVLEIQKQAQAKWQEEEERLSKQLQDLQNKLSELQRQRTDGNRFQLSAGQQAEISKFREQERQIRKRRREVRKNLREDIENLGHKLVLANLLVTPFIVSCFGMLVFRSRSRREREEKSNG